MADIIREVQVLETRPAGKVLRGVAWPARFLPRFEYKLAVSYLEDGTGQCWSQIDGDFRKNGGSQSYMWDSNRRQTLAMFTFEIELKGMLSVLPRGPVMRLTARTLPDYMRSLVRVAQRVERDDAARAARVETRWHNLRARLESDELEGRTWPAGGHGPLLSGGRSTAPGDGGQ